MCTVLGGCVYGHPRMTSAYVCIRQRTSAHAATWRPADSVCGYVSIRQRMQHTSAYVSVCGCIGGLLMLGGPQTALEQEHLAQHTSAYVSIRQHTSAYAATWRPADCPRARGASCTPHLPPPPPPHTHTHKHTAVPR
jgi:hypothetical protein